MSIIFVFIFKVFFAIITHVNLVVVGHLGGSVKLVVMKLERIQIAEYLVTHFAIKGLRRMMFFQMTSQYFVLGECFVANITIVMSGIF